MADHIQLEGDKEGWKKHDAHLRAIMRLTREMLKRFELIRENGTRIAKCSTQITRSLRVKTSGHKDGEFFVDNTRRILDSPHNPKMTLGAIKTHHQNVEQIVKILRDQVTQSGRLHDAFTELHEHANALMMMFKS
jgi:hypothetical protein